MTIATTADTTRIFIDRSRFIAAMSVAALQGQALRFALPRDAIVHHCANEVTEAGPRGAKRQSILVGMGVYAGFGAQSMPEQPPCAAGGLQ